MGGTNQNTYCGNNVVVLVLNFDSKSIISTKVVLFRPLKQLKRKSKYQIYVIFCAPLK